MLPAYYRDVFDVKDYHSARNIILTPEDGATTDQRWRIETPHIVDLICNNTNINSHSRVLDYGCGIGRISKALIEKVGCTVVGADIIPSMRAIANAYVNNSKFIAIDPEILSNEFFFSHRFDLTISIWALQHVEDPNLELLRAHCSMPEKSELFVVNEGNSDRVVPFKGGWFNDGIVLRDEIEKLFNLRKEGKLDPAFVPQSQSERTFWAVYDRI